MLKEPDQALRGLGRFLIAAFLCGAIALGFEQALAGAALPLFKAWIALIDGSLRTVDLSVVDVDGESTIRRLTTPLRVLVVGTTVLDVDERTVISTSALTGILLQPVVLGIALLLAWPWKSLAELAVRFLLGLPLLLMVVLLDLPLILCGYAWLALIDAYEPGRFSLLVDWADFMNAGGRFALVVLAVANAVALARHVAGPRRRACAPTDTGLAPKQS
jgi:hypothetical protein